MAAVRWAMVVWASVAVAAAYPAVVVMATPSTAEKKCPGPLFWKCGKGECCVELRAGGRDALPACAPCDAVPECRGLMETEHRIGKSLRHQLPKGLLLDGARTDWCKGQACNAPSKYADLPPNIDAWSNHCFDHVAGKSLLRQCHDLYDCCATLTLVSNHTWATGCAACKSSDLHFVNDDAWPTDTLVCPATHPVVPLDEQVADKGTNKLRTWDLANKERNRTTKAATTTSTTKKPTTSTTTTTTTTTPTTTTTTTPTTTTTTVTRRVPACEITGGACPVPGECCSTISGADGQLLHFCLPCNLIRHTALSKEHEQGARSKCASVAEWERASMVSLQPFLPSVHGLLKAQNKLGDVQLCKGYGCNRPSHFEEVTPSKEQGKGQWCFHYSPLSRFFKSNSDGKMAALVKCGDRHQECCSFAEHGKKKEKWAIGCAQCEAFGTELYEEEWMKGEISPWRSDAEVCGWLEEDGDKKVALSSKSTETDGGGGSSLCRAEGVEPHFSWECPGADSCCLTVGKDEPSSPRLPACVPCPVAHKGYGDISPAEPLCRPLTHWRTKTDNAIDAHIPTLDIFFRDHAWVLDGSTTILCGGYACNKPSGYEVPAKMEGEKDLWCWHHSPLNKFFSGNEGGEKAILARCKEGEQCCSTLELFNGDVWSLGCHKCKKGEQTKVPAAEFFAASKDKALSPWDAVETEVCVWEPGHRCMYREQGGGAAREKACPETECCFTGKGGILGCAPCRHAGTCHSWARHQVDAKGRKLLGVPLIGFYRPQPRSEFGSSQEVCVCRGAMCNGPLAKKTTTTGARLPHSLSRAVLKEGTATDEYISPRNQQRISAAMDEALRRMNKFEMELVNKGHQLKSAAKRLLVRPNGQMVFLAAEREEKSHRPHKKALTATGGAQGLALTTGTALLALICMTAIW